VVCLAHFPTFYVKQMECHSEKKENGIIRLVKQVKSVV
jgi:hypothetical protein